MRFAIRLPPYVSPTPSAPTRIPITVEAVVREAEKGGRISLHYKLKLRIMLAERTFCADLGFQPLVGNCARISARAIAVIFIAADACPCSGRIFAAVRAARLDDVMQVWKLTTNPGTRIVLV